KRILLSEFRSISQKSGRIERDNCVPNHSTSPLEKHRTGAAPAIWASLMLISVAPVFSQDQREMDATKVGLRSRAEVIKILAPPSQSIAADQDAYAWGFAAYTNGRLDQIDFQFKAPASTVS